MKRLVPASGDHAHLLVLEAFDNDRAEDIELVLVMPDRYPYYSGMLPGWMAGHYREEDWRIDLAYWAERAGARLVHLVVAQRGLLPGHAQAARPRAERCPAGCVTQVMAHLGTQGTLKNGLYELLEDALELCWCHRPRNALFKQLGWKVQRVRHSGRLCLAWHSCALLTCHASHTNVRTGSRIEAALTSSQVRQYCLTTGNVTCSLTFSLHSGAAS